jgi:E3 ubiquitin-protein ligase HUWE1
VDVPCSSLVPKTKFTVKPHYLSIAFGHLQVDLHEWVEPLNKIDACLSYYVQKYPCTLLVGPVERTASKVASKSLKLLTAMPAQSLEEVGGVPDTVPKNLCILVKFLAALLENSSNKSVFNSVDELVDLLASANDNLASCALEALCNLCIPPALHKQQVPENQQHSTALHVSKPASHRRLVALARGWGTRGSGLGLYTCAVADDSEFGQGALPQQAGDLHFTFFKKPVSEETRGNDEMDESCIVRITLPAHDMLDDSAMLVDGTKNNEETNDSSKQKRRRVAPASPAEKSIRSTAELFFQCLQQAGGRNSIPEDRLFHLLADIRLTRSFHCHATRVAAIERRLRALVAVLHSHPSQEVMTGYFQAQPELCVELIDLLRPTVSSAAVSSASSTQPSLHESSPNHNAIAALANSPGVPYEIRQLALESLTALVGRREGTNGALTGAARHSNVLTELGVGKGLYLGLLPTLIRFSLASLRSLVSGSSGMSNETVAASGTTSEDTLAMEIGLAFVEAAAPPPLPRVVQFEKALLFIDSVLTLTSAVVSTPTGTSALTESGLIPGLLNTVSIDTDECIKRVFPESSSEVDACRVRALLRFITAQAVQILEGSIVTHNSALSAFHNLKGVEVLTTRLSKEILIARSRRMRAESMEGVTGMEIDGKGVDNFDLETSPKASQRVLLFGIVTCLTVVFHQESTSSSVSAPSGAAELRKPELTAAVIEILDNVDVYGGHLAALIATLLSDVMNSDPHVVQYVHESGLARSFLKMLSMPPSDVPIPPPVPELIMAIPNVLAALALTEAGSKAIEEANPFAALLKIFHHPKYAMPRSRCLLNEMTAIVGTGLDEIMRNVQSLKGPICRAIANALLDVVSFGQLVVSKEDKLNPLDCQTASQLEVDSDRSCLMQYALNFGQILEQILHNEDHCDPFVKAGGLEAILKLYPYVMPTGERFLAHVGCLSCPSVSTICHSTTEDTLTLAFKCIALRYDPMKLIQICVDAIKSQIGNLESAQLDVKATFPTTAFDSGEALDASFILEGIPLQPVFELTDDSSSGKKISLANYLRHVVILQWMTGLLAAVIKAACQRSNETIRSIDGSGWRRTEREWRNELSSPEFQDFVLRLSRFHQSATFEVCRIRSEEGYEDRERKRLLGNESDKVRYKLRIVCAEGAVVRDGIEIDSCASVGTMEMGEIVEAFDRCINSSGVLRYRTHRGWLSEQTRGHGREPIAEVMAVWKSTIDGPSELERETKGRIESGVPDLRSSAANVLARMQTSYADLYSSLTRLAMQSMRTVLVRNVSFQPGSIGAHIAATMKMLSTGIQGGFNRPEVLAAIRSVGDSRRSINNFGAALYLGSLLNHAQICLFEEKRDRTTVNLPLLCALMATPRNESRSRGPAEENEIDVFDSIGFIFEQSLVDFDSRARVSMMKDIPKRSPYQRLDRTIASSLPPATAMLRRLLSCSSLNSSPLAPVLAKLKDSEVAILVGGSEVTEPSTSTDPSSSTMFSPEKFTRTVLCKVSASIRKPWVDQRFKYAPSYVVHPISMLISETIHSLEESTKDFLTSTLSNSVENPTILHPFRSMVLAGVNRSVPASGEETDFSPSEVAISRLMEMGFSRDHAWDALDSSRSNRLEVAMEYALSHPPPSPSTIERRRNDRETRLRQREAQVSEAAEGDTAVGGEDPTPVRNHLRENAISESMEVDQTRDNDQQNVDSRPATDGTIPEVTSQISAWKAEASTVACSILSEAQASHVEANGDGDGEKEALTVVLSSFLLELCEKYPDESERIVREIYSRLARQIVECEGDDGIIWQVLPGHESSVSCLCHCAVLLARALPKTRVLLLKEGLVKRLVSLLVLFVKNSGDESGVIRESWPLWIPPALLVLDVLAQPIVAFSVPGDTTEDLVNEDGSEDHEFSQVKEDHRRHAERISAIAQDIFLALNPVVMTDTEGSDEPAETGAIGEGTPISRKSNVAEALFQKVPAYVPLLPAESLATCVDVCLKLIADETAPPPPGIVHACLLLLMRLLRNPKISSYCLKAGAGEKILNLPRSCRFQGHSGLVAVVFRRLLEDEATLQSLMESEIRSTIIKLDGKKEGSASNDKKPICVSRKAFVKASIPLLCRDPTTFVKAVAVSVVFEQGAQGSDGRIALLTPSEKARNLKIVSEVTKLKDPSSPQGRGQLSRSVIGSKHRRPSTATPVQRSKTPIRSNKRHQPPKRSKKEKGDQVEIHEDQDNIRHQSHFANPVSHITWLLINNVILKGVPVIEASESQDYANQSFKFGFENSFLWAADTLDVLADLVLAIPACATAIHKFKASRKIRVSMFSHLSNALYGCPSPPRTFVSFLLHGLLSQDRSTSLVSAGAARGSSETSEQAMMKIAHLRAKVAQSTARVLISLVARPGEGRRRVIAELVFALSGGQLGLSTDSTVSDVGSPLHPHSSDLHALQAWGELCIGFAAPRSNSGNYDGDAALSFEVLKIMLENGMAHALLIAIHRVPLHHPMASSSAGALILPFEIMTRSSVVDVVKTIADKELRSKDFKESTRGATSSSSELASDRTPEAAQRHDSFADDIMLEDAFAADAPGGLRSSLDDSFADNEVGEDIDDDDEDIVMEGTGQQNIDDADEEGAGMEIDEGIDEEVSDDDVSSESGSSDSSSEGVSDEEGDDDEDEDDDDDDDDNEDEDEEDDQSIMEDSSGTHSSEDFEEDGFDVDYREDSLIEDNEFEASDETGTDRVDNLLEEGWTRVESSGLGIIGTRRGAGQTLGGNLSGRTRGFFDAAEAMLGTLLRTGELHGDALAEIEGTLGIRIVSHNGRVPGPASGHRPNNGLNGIVSRQGAEGNTSVAGQRDVLGSIPHIRQRNQPDLGYSVLGAGNRWNEINSMEYVYGGPCITAGNRNYDLVSPVVHPDDDAEPNVNVHGTPHLFPGGPASATHARTQHSPHPLLVGVDLPPPNALVSDLVAHGVRARRNGQSTRQRPGEWTNSGAFGRDGFVASNGNGNVIRSNRQNSAISGSTGESAAPVGWTDDGLPFDATVELFSSAFENALSEAMSGTIDSHASATDIGDSGNNINDDHETIPGPDSQQDSNASSGQPNAEVAMNDETQSQEGAEAESRNVDTVERDLSSEANDGGGVVTSLAAGLRLSQESNDINESLDLQPGEDHVSNAINEQVPEQGTAVDEGEQNPFTDDQREPLHDGQQLSTPEDIETLGVDSIEVSASPNGLLCPEGMDPEVFNVLPFEMQQEVVAQARVASDVAEQLDAGSLLDPEALAALPEDMRREVIEQEQQERRMRDQTPADPSNAEEMDNASFVASLSPELRNEILLTADDDFIRSLPPIIAAEAQVLRERATASHRRHAEDAADASQREVMSRNTGSGQGQQIAPGERNQDQNDGQNSSKRAHRGKIRVESDRDDVVYIPTGSCSSLTSAIAKSDLKVLIRFMYLLSPVRPHKLLQKVFQNVSMNGSLRLILSSTFLKLLHDDKMGALHALETTERLYSDANDWRKKMDVLFEKSMQDFPPPLLIGAAPEVLETDMMNPNIQTIRSRQINDTAASIAANLPLASRGSHIEQYLPPVVATRIVDVLQQLSKSSQRFCLDMLIMDVISAENGSTSTGFESLLDLLEKPKYAKSSASLEALLSLLESIVAPLSQLPKLGEEDFETSERDIESAASQNKEWVDVPRVTVSQKRLQLLCSILRMETCRDTSFTKVNTIARRLCRVDDNRGYILAELASVARALGVDAMRDLKALNVRMTVAVSQKCENRTDDENSSDESKKMSSVGCSASTSVAVSTSTSELKLLRVLQTLQSLCTETSDDGSSKKVDGSIVVTDEFVRLLDAMNLDDLWSELTSCLRVVQVLEGVNIEEDADKKAGESIDEGGDEDNENGGKKLQNSVAGLLTRFLPSIEAFFVANASSTRSLEASNEDDPDPVETNINEDSGVSSLVGGVKLVEFVEANKVLLNALIRNNSGLLDKGLKAIIQVHRCRVLLDFDVKRHWFKLQVRRLRQQANRRHGSLRLHIRRKHVFEDTYHQLRLRNADEMRGRLHITFRDEQGVDAGGLSREFFGILAKEIFNPNYALFTSTEDGSTFQPNPNSSINPDHLSYFRFVGRIVGKAVSDGYLLDAHFTRSLYKHMLCIKPTHHDMEAIDPDYYKNLQTILEFDLGDIGLDLTFSIEDHSFGRSQTLDLIPNGRNVAVTEDNKSKYVSLVCQHRMTTAISSQIKAYLDGFYELVSKDLIQIFTPRELELLISGLPDIDVHDLKKNTDYVGWKSTDKQIGWFWNVLFSLSRNQKASFLQFVTGSSKVPLAGFGELPGMRGVQKFSIHKTGGGSSGALMSAHTCFNSLDLPVYSSEDELREKLLYAINEGGGTFLLA